MDTTFERAVAHILDNEGGYVDHPNDPGGATNYGISLRFLRSEGMLDRDQDGCPDGDTDLDGDIDVDDIRGMTREKATAIYYHFWWLKYRYDRLPPLVAAKVFDLSVNMGPGSARKTGAHVLLQRACHACGYPVTEDGIIGPQTLTAIEAIGSEAWLLIALRSEAAGRYRELVAHNSRLGVFLRGWLRRAYQ